MGMQISKHALFAFHISDDQVIYAQNYNKRISNKEIIIKV